MKALYYLLAKTGLIRKFFGDDIGDWLIGLGLPAVIAYLVYKVADGEEKDVNGLLLYLSALVPIIGLVLYFLKKSEDKHTAQLCLGCAAVSGVLNFIMFMVS